MSALYEIIYTENDEWAGEQEVRYTFSGSWTELQDHINGLREMGCYRIDANCISDPDAEAYEAEVAWPEPMLIKREAVIPALHRWAKLHREARQKFLNSEGEYEFLTKTRDGELVHVTLDCGHIAWFFTEKNSWSYDLRRKEWRK